MLSEEQLHMRMTGIGASEAAAACGMSPWKQTVELYLQKIGEAKPIEENRDLMFGRFMEAGGISYWSAMRGIDVKYPLPTIRHPEYPFILATGDAQIDAGHGLEFKTMEWWRWRQMAEAGIEDVAPEYVMQAQHQMLVMGWEKVTLAVLVGKDLHDVPVGRNDRLQKMIVDRESTFWRDHVEKRIPPDVDFSREDALRCVQALYPQCGEETVQLSDASCEAWVEYESIGQAIRDQEAQRKALKARVLAEIGENYAGVLSDGTRMIRRKWVDGSTYTVERDGFYDVRAVKCR